ncbi:hypothetical protein DFJ74DRAFT_656423 [Hyaloraphidium curvatum]|nr:hypothetical protein DFJ74DRAFT_656423 [Hyaloraphidium curvatum]
MLYCLHRELIRRIVGETRERYGIGSADLVKAVRDRELAGLTYGQPTAQAAEPRDIPAADADVGAAAQTVADQAIVLGRRHLPSAGLHEWEAFADKLYMDSRLEEVGVHLVCHGLCNLMGFSTPATVQAHLLRLGAGDPVLGLETLKYHAYELGRRLYFGLLDWAHGKGLEIDQNTARDVRLFAAFRAQPNARVLPGWTELGAIFIKSDFGTSGPQLLISADDYRRVAAQLPGSRLEPEPVGPPPVSVGVCARALLHRLPDGHPLQYVLELFRNGFGNVSPLWSLLEYLLSLSAMQTIGDVRRIYEKKGIGGIAEQLGVKQGHKLDPYLHRDRELDSFLRLYFASNPVGGDGVEPVPSRKELPYFGMDERQPGSIHREQPFNAVASKTTSTNLEHRALKEVRRGTGTPGPVHSAAVAIPPPCFPHKRHGRRHCLALASSPCTRLHPPGPPRPLEERDRRLGAGSRCSPLRHGPRISLCPPLAGGAGCRPNHGRGHPGDRCCVPVAEAPGPELLPAGLGHLDGGHPRRLHGLAVHQPHGMQGDAGVVSRCDGRYAQEVSEA